MEKKDETNLFGGKVFFLYPSAYVQNQLIPELAQEEFEVYVAKDEAKLRQVLKKYPQSVVFACISEGMRENAWEEWIKGILSADETAGVNIGILNPEDNKDLRRKYTEQLKVSCGYTVLKSAPAGVIKQLSAILNNVNAKGRRKYLRALMDQGPNTTVNFPINGNFVNGYIKDISAVGFSCFFEEDPVIAKNTLFENIQIRLQSQLVKVEGIMFGSRSGDDKKVYVILFTQRISPDVKTRIRRFIQSSLQAKMDPELK